MDSMIAAASRALATGDALGALKRVALRDDAAALALRGIAMAQLGELAGSRELLRRAARRFGTHEEAARARCVVAEAEVALAMREFASSSEPLAAAAAILDARGDHDNALLARLIAVRRLLMLGRLGEAATALTALKQPPPRAWPPGLVASAELVAMELAQRTLATVEARASLARAGHAANRSRVPALQAEVQEARAALDRPAARRLSLGREQVLRLDEVADLFDSGALVVDACRRGLQARSARLPLARRPVLFRLVRSLGEAWPGDVPREALIALAFGQRHPDETHRARLRVEIGRLRHLAGALATIEATSQGYALRPHDGRDVVVLLPPVDGEEAALLALLGDGAAWSTSALSLALGESQRTIQRSLADLDAARRVRSIGRGRAQRWLAPPLVGFTTILLLPGSLSPQ